VIANQKSRLGALQVLVQCLVEPSSLVEVSVNAILYLLRRVSVKMIGLPLHWA
jgi:hypothetical protein